MATTTSVPQNGEISREDVQSAINKATELRALHAALIQGSNLRFQSSSSSSPVSRHVSNFSAHDYPVFTPSYEDEPLPGNQSLAEISWDDVYGSQARTTLFDYKNQSSPMRKGSPKDFTITQSHFCPETDRNSVTGSSTNQIRLSQTSPCSEFNKQTIPGDIASPSSSSCNKCKPAVVISTSNENANKNNKNIASDLQPRSRGVISWLFPRLKKKNKRAGENESSNSPNRAESEEVSQILKDIGILSIESLKRELQEANEKRDAALMEVQEMRSSVVEISQKLEYLESYCEELKKALRQANPNCLAQEKLRENPRKGKSSVEPSLIIPVSEEVMVEGFLQIVSEARLSVKQFCRTLVSKIDETDETLISSLNSVLKPYNLSLNMKFSKTVQYHLESIINKTLFQDFENSGFEKDGTPMNLDPRQDRMDKFSSFVSLRNLSWNEVLHKGTKFHSEEFSKFCDQKMSSVITSLNWTRPWHEDLLQCFFVAAKCVWLLHLLAFSFEPALSILRVEENRGFDSHYMEDIVIDRQKSHCPSKVKIMVMPGFYVKNRVLKCKVLCRYKSIR